MKSISSIALGKVKRGKGAEGKQWGEGGRKEVSVPHAKKHEIMKMDKWNMKGNFTYLQDKERKKSGTNVQHANSI